MHKFKEEVEQRIYELKQVIKEKAASLCKAPEGSVHVYATGKNGRFYTKEQNKRRYMKKAEMPLIIKLCQKDYDRKVLKVARQELKELEKIKKIHNVVVVEEVYENIHPERKKLVQPIWLPDKEYIEEWEKEEYTKKYFMDDVPEHYTDREERVRSKSEALIANALNRHKIPYRYEQPLYLNGYGTIHPDFTVLNVRLRKEMYWEHMGLMDNYEYAEAALRRIETYEKNNIFPGKQLILTHETARYPINLKHIEKVIEQYL